MVPLWLNVIAVIWLTLSILSAIFVLADIHLGGYRQHMKVMELVWPITMLYLGPIGLAFYLWAVRRQTMKYHMAHGKPDLPKWAGLLTTATHCGAGCTLGDIIAETLIWAFRITIFGAAIWASFILDYAFALILGVLFQYAAIQQMGRTKRSTALKRAAKADVLSLTAFEVGLFAWMALMFWVFFPGPHLDASYVAFWFLMQVGMAIGLMTSMPMNMLLIRIGIKESM